MGVSRYEDLRVWQEARKFCQEISAILERPAFRRDFALRNQLNDAPLSTMANIAGGFLRRRDKEFNYFLRIAAGSNGEARTLLHAACDRGHVTEPESLELIEQTNSIGRMLRALQRTLRSDPDQEPRTKN